MNELPRNPDSPLPAIPAPIPPPVTLQWERTAAAGLLSLFLPGMGQLYNRQPRKAFIVAIITHVFGALVAHTRLLLSFWTMVGTVVVLAVWQVFAAAEAARSAAEGKKPESPIPLPWLTYPVLGIIIVFSALAPSPMHTMHESGFAAYKIPSTSMCPTICAGERVVADSWAYQWKPPQRGDLVLLEHASSDALFVKRVVGISGDVVEPGPDGGVLVNGQPLHPPSPCESFSWQKVEAANYSDFHATRVAEGTFFVVGDNLESSYDSRIAAFGAVNWEMMRARPLYFYWSPNRRRIGCSIH